MATDTNAVKEFIRVHILEIKTLKEVAARLNLCSETLRKDFLRKEKMQISSFLLGERINKMKQLLEESDLRCFEICAQFGIREDSGETTFKRVVGMSMQAYRELAAPFRSSTSTADGSGLPKAQKSGSLMYAKRNGNGRINGNQKPENGSTGDKPR